MLVKAKLAAFGTPEANAAAQACSKGIFAEFNKWADSMQERLAAMSQGSRGWWSLASDLQKLRKKDCSIPGMKDKDGNWILDNSAKASLFRTTFAAKFSVPETDLNEFSRIVPYAGSIVCAEPEATPEDAVRVLQKLDEHSGTGPDMLPSRVLKQCANELALPISMLTNAIPQHGEWPLMWLIHWIVPLFKKGVIFDPGKYRGIHLTAQLSKVVERIIGNKLNAYLAASLAFGENQFAYSRKEALGTC